MKETNLTGHNLTSYERTERQRRISQLDMLIDTGIDPYPTHFPQRTHSIKEIVNSPDNLIDTEVVIAGRIIGQRNHKNATFLDVRDFSGEMQAMADKSRLEAIQFNLARTAFSSGDIAAITGIVTRTRRGSTAVDATDLTMLSKSLLPLPTQLQGAENRHAKRHLDLLANEESREILIARNRITRQIRSILEERDLIEVESPIVNTFYNGGVAKPFITHHNALSEPAYLRMTSELYLKRIITSGIEGVYEMSKQFRNEGMGGIYSPEFTVLEAYKAYEDHEWMMDLIQDIIQKSALSVNDSLETTWQGNQIDLSGDWPRMPMHSAVGISLGLGSEPSSDDIYRSADKLGIEGEYGEVLGNIFRRITEPTLIQPTFITDFPTSLSPLAKSDPNHADHVLKFMLYIGGTLISDGNYEENDPLKQRANLTEQERVQIQQGIDQYPRDADFLDALEHGMPPVSGSAIGIDRLTMLITGNDNIREVMAFRPKRSKKY